MSDTEPAGSLDGPRYDMLPERVQQLTGELLQAHAERLPNPQEYRYVAIEVAGNSRFANIGRSIEHAVFDDEFENDPEELANEYGPYESASRFFISVDQVTHQPTGVLRVIANSESGLKSWDDAVSSFKFDTSKASRRKGLQDLDQVWDVGTIAVLPQMRGKSGPISILLERAMYVSAKNHDVQALISIVDTRPLVKMRSRLRGVGIPFQSLPGTRPGFYLGSEKSLPVSGYVPEFYDKMSKHRESLWGRMLAKYVLGDALDRLVEGTADQAIILLNDYKKQNA